MTENNHLELSTYVKKIHEDLRTQSHLLGENNAWKLHCSNEMKLKAYATAMKQLSLVWESNFLKGSKAVSRIIWSVETCVTYFTDTIEYFRVKEYSVVNKYDLPMVHMEKKSFTNKWILLDVGSCYNPFKDFKQFDVIPIDIAPATDEVYKCDFLNVDIGTNYVLNLNEITNLRSNSFDIVVFSLFLEYLPSPTQRLECCDRAYKLLRTEGLLIIITPDSKHVGANAQLIKSWRFILGKMGFSRIKYEKLPHIHCMAFRKSFNKEIVQNWVKLHKDMQSYNQMFIPQDLTQKSLVLDNQDNNVIDLNVAIELFSELPEGF